VNLLVGLDHTYFIEPPLTNSLILKPANGATASFSQNCPMPHSVQRMAGLFMYPQQVLPGAEIASEAEALRDLEA
jgi:hypothetical protein